MEKAGEHRCGATWPGGSAVACELPRAHEGDIHQGATVSPSGATRVCWRDMLPLIDGWLRARDAYTRAHTP